MKRQELANPIKNQQRPNVIWFMVDQMRAQAMSHAGDPNVNTPNLDRMIRDGVYFPKACMGFPLCCPARASMVTSQYPHKTIPGHEFKLDPKLTTIADPFNEAGYHTAWLGKWHLDGWHESNGRGAWCKVDREHRGRFKTWIGYENNNSQWDSWVHGHDEDQEVDIYQLPGHETDALTDLLLDQIDRHQHEPFFHVCSVQPPHDPYSAPAKYAGRHNPATLKLRANVPSIPKVEKEARKNLAGYYALIEQVDANVGRVMDHLEKLGLKDNTYLMFFSDHGDHMGSHGHTHKMTPYEESIRVPFMIWSGQRAGYGSHELPYVSNHVDMAPTALGLCGISCPESFKGFDYGTLIREKRIRGAEVPEEAYLQSVVPTQHHPSIDLPWRGIATKDGWKYVALEGQPFMLFDLNEDPYEQRNLAHHAHSAMKRKNMNDRLQTWITKTDDTFELPKFDEQGHPLRTEAITEEFQKKANWVP